RRKSRCHLNHHRQPALLYLSEQQVRVYIVPFECTTAEDRFAQLASPFQRPKPKPLRIKQQDGIHVLALQQLRGARGRFTGHSLGFPSGSLLHLIAKDTDSEAGAHGTQGRLVTLVPEPAETDDADSQGFFHSLESW